MTHIYNLLKEKPNLLPPDFNYKQYLEYNPDLIYHGISTEELAILHYINHGKKEQRSYKPTSLVGSIDQSFDAGFYLSEYPDVNTYYEGVRTISLEEKLYHHYLHYGKPEGRFKNHHEKTQAIKHCQLLISNYIQQANLICPKNILQCICLLVTDIEIKNQQYDNFLKQVIQYTKKNKYTTQLDFKIIVNNHSEHIDTHILQKLFNSVDIIDLQLSPEEDIYQPTLLENQKMPDYGLKSGPNLMFFKTIELCAKYNTILLLETDCILGQNWVSNIYHYTRYANGFLISGATYDGNTFTKAGSPMMNHLNGGTSLYATYHPVLQALVKLCAHFLKQQVNHRMSGLAYDYAMKLLIDSGLDTNIHNRAERQIWQFINRNYLPCKLIINCSTRSDSALDPNVLYKQYNYSILHKKYTK